jgi:hypothetical protein
VAVVGGSADSQKTLPPRAHGPKAAQDAMDMFAGVVAGTVSPVEFFDSENITRILGAASAA